MMRIATILCFCCVVLCGARPALGLDPGMRLSQYAHAAWKSEDAHFGGGSPLAIAQTRDGYLWIGTLVGLTRFDGVRFTQWKPPAGETLPSPLVSALLGARDGSLWIGSDGTLSRWKDGQLAIHEVGKGVVVALAEARDGTIWFTLVGGVNPDTLCRIADDAVRCGGAPDGITYKGLSSIAEDPGGGIWVGAERSVILSTAEGSVAFPIPGLENEVGMGVSAVAPAPDGTVVVGTTAGARGLGLLRVVQGGQVKPMIVPGFDASRLSVLSLHVDRHGRVWVGTVNQGLYRIGGDRVEHFGSADGLTSGYVVRFLEDREGTLWVLTSKGLNQLRERSVIAITPREGLSTNEVDSVLASRDGAVWIGGAEALSVFRAGSLSAMRAGKDLPGSQVTSLFEDRAGRLLVGVDKTLTILQQGRFRQIRDDALDGAVTSLAEDTDGNVWAAIWPGKLVRIRDERVREVLQEPLVPPVKRVAADPAGGIWLGLRSGDLARFREGKLTTYALRDIAPPVTNAWGIEQLHVNEDGSVLGAASFGLLGWRDGAMRVLTMRNGLPCDRFVGLVVDRAGWLWLYAQCGLLGIPPGDVQAWWKDANAKVHPTVLDVFDGWLPAIPPFDAATRSRDGRLWFASEGAVQVVDPGNLRKNLLPPPVAVEAVVADRKSYVPASDLGLPELTRDVQIDYTAPSFVIPQRVRFKYRLEGHDSDWVDAGTRRQAFYTDLGPGDYRFRVIACNSDGVWNQEGVSLRVIIPPAWHQTWLFRALCLVVAALLLWALYRWRLRRIKDAISARFDERLAERTRIARDIHDTLLQTIQGSKMVADDALDSTDPTRMRSALERLSAWLGRAIDEGRAALDSLRTSATETNDLMAAFKRATEGDTQLRPLDVLTSVAGHPRDMHPIVRDEVYRIGYEAIRNASRHSGASRMSIEIEYGENLTLRIGDNGVGIDPALAQQGKPGHFGLSGMRERAARIEATLAIAGAEGGGTVIALVVPGGIAYRAPRASAIDGPGAAADTRL